MKIIKKVTADENDERIECDYYVPESAIKETKNIQEALNSLEYEVIGFHYQSYNNYELQIKLHRGFFPNSLIKDAKRIQEALKPLRFEVLGFCNNHSRFEYILHLWFIEGFSHDSLDDFWDTADSHEVVVIDSPHDKPYGAE